MKTSRLIPSGSRLSLFLSFFLFWLLLLLLLFLFNSIGLDIDGCCIQSTDTNLSVQDEEKKKKKEARPGNEEENWSFSSLKKTAHTRTGVPLLFSSLTPTHTLNRFYFFFFLFFCAFVCFLLYVEHPQETQSRHVSL